MTYGKGCTVLIVLVLSLVFAGGCSKKSSGDRVSSSRKPEAYALSSGKAGNIEGENIDGALDEEHLAGDAEPLDQTSNKPFSQGDGSPEYLAVYGRSTAPLYPVFFAFDSSAIAEDQLANLNSSGQHLVDKSSLKLVVEGNCDERGTTDYNLALGELRALNVKKYLENVGVASDRITTVSYGSQRPLHLGHDEVSWAGNRRADLVAY